MNKILFFLVVFFALLSMNSYADSRCPWCRGTGIYHAPSARYTTEGTYHKCSMCGKVYSSRYGHSCRCVKCNGTGYMAHKSSSVDSHHRSNDYSNDIFVQNMDWDKAAIGCLFTGNPCGLVRSAWIDRNTAFAQFQIRQPLNNNMYQWYGGLIDKLETIKANELSRQYGRRIKYVTELYDYRGILLKITVR